MNIINQYELPTRNGGSVILPISLSDMNMMMVIHSIVNLPFLCINQNEHLDCSDTNPCHPTYPVDYPKLKIVCVWPGVYHNLSNYIGSWGTVRGMVCHYFWTSVTFKVVIK